MIASFAAACSSTVPVQSPTPAPPVVTIDPGLIPRMTPEQVEAIVLAQIHSMETMVGHVMRPPRVLTIKDVSGVRWNVRAEGTFTTNRYPPRARPGVAAAGFFGINDADGSVDFGYP